MSQGIEQFTSAAGKAGKGVKDTGKKAYKEVEAWTKSMWDDYIKQNKTGSEKLMSFQSTQPRYTDAVIDCSNDEVKTEQNHKGSVDINDIVNKHGIDKIAANSKHHGFNL